MPTIKILCFCFVFAGILFFRPCNARLIHFHSKSSSVVSYVSDPPLSAFVYSSSSLIPTPSMEEESGGQEVHKAENHHHSSVAGGGVIIGGLATAFFATLYCYIRVTRKKDGDEKH
ncbi:hypothetical protein CTI12_AA116190 [Artemisia annua]|uniref:Transmembrane protein n=1 Tax=Artemisia annua TaxID=35608 RepID=A0A2U1PT81_ARTAN|nr:hypothetical protein CTI12_AA116190 [Artemisia annua]